ncbi:tol-pal system protein YbgF [compost metagenome]
MKKLVLLVSIPVLMTGCLKTRNDVQGNNSRQVMQQQVVTMQRATADTGNRFADIEEQMRNLNGRIEVVENRVGQGHAGVENALRNSQQQNQDTNQKVALLQDALTKMETQLFQLTAEVQGLRAEKAAVQAEKTAKQAKKDSFEAAQEFFDKKDWKQAILNFQKYRDQSPKGKNFADSTYKIGVAFQELGMKEEAKTFYDEVVSKFPKSEEARRAKIRLKGLKK